MENSLHRDLKGRCRETFGAGLRIAFWYSLENGVEYGTVRFRGDLRDSYPEVDERRVIAATLVTDMRENEPEVYPEQLPDTGDLQATTHVFESAVVVHVTVGPWGLVVSYDADREVDLVSFVEFCRAWLRRAERGADRSTADDPTP